ncbi:hypothetical protein [Rhizobium lusitanum]|uniref:hypothetical protein n=1 Tax=Rhizobium lusitanum TaxID=293958 RepID=UPI0025733881|nr:hypothetical protein [Rhizobium lusitanum]
MRICLSAPLIVRACESAQALESLIDQAMAVLDRTAFVAAQLAPRSEAIRASGG